MSADEKGADGKSKYVVKSAVFSSISNVVKQDLNNFFKDVGANSTTLGVNVVDKKTDKVFYVENGGEIILMMMVTKPKTMKFTSLKYADLQKCDILYNLIFKPESGLIESNKLWIDMILSEITKTHKCLAFVLPVDPTTHKLMHPVMEYFGSKFNSGNIERSIYMEFTNLPVIKTEKFEPNLEHYDPIGNVLFL